MMKYLLIAVVFLWMGCKKEKADRDIEVVGYNFKCDYYLSTGTKYNTSGGLQPKGKLEFKIEGNNEASITVTSVTKGARFGEPDTLNEGFRLTIVSDKKTIYDAYGSNHHYKF